MAAILSEGVHGVDAARGGTRQVLETFGQALWGGRGDPANTRTIANRLQLGIKTVQAYCARIEDKLNLANATELLREAIRWTGSNAF